MILSLEHQQLREHTILELTVNDSGLLQGSASTSITVANVGETISVSITTSVPPVVNQPVTVTADVTGGTPPYTYTWTDLPTGLVAINSDAITGTPTGDWNF